MQPEVAEIERGLNVNIPPFEVKEPTKGAKRENREKRWRADIVSTCPGTAGRSMDRYSKCLAIFARPQESCFLRREGNRRRGPADYCRARSSRRVGSRPGSRATGMDSGVGYGRRDGRTSGRRALVPVAA